MNDALMQEILIRLDTLGEKVGQGAEFTFETMMRQSFLVHGIGQVVLAVLLVGLVWGGIKAAFWFCRPAPEPDDQRNSWSSRREYAIDDEMARGLGATVAGLAAGISGIVSLATFWSGIQHIINPQYYALMDLAKMLTGK